jgi:hypothetical protein
MRQFLTGKIFKTPVFLEKDKTAVQRSTWIGWPSPRKSYSEITGGIETYLEIMKNENKKVLIRFLDSFIFKCVTVA